MRDSGAKNIYVFVIYNLLLKKTFDFPLSKYQIIKSSNFICLLLLTFDFSAQSDAHKIYDGNNAYYGGKVPDAALHYNKALELNPNNKKANFNLGDALYKSAEMYRSGNLSLPVGANIRPDSMAKIIYGKAADNFAVVANSVSNKDTLHSAWHNIGNCYLQKKEFQEAVNAFKKSLKFNPKDEETRYNLAYALKNLPKDKKNGGGGAQPKQQPQQNKNDKKEQQGKPEQGKMSKEQAEQLLKALMDNERKLQEKRKQKAESNNSVDKDW